MRLVIIESPYAGDVAANEAYARAAMRHSLLKGEAPIASHLLYTQPGILDDGKSGERALGMEAGWAWMRRADAVVVYEDLGISPGMKEGIERAFLACVPVEYRRLASVDTLPKGQDSEAGLVRSKGGAVPPRRGRRPNFPSKTGQ